MRTLPYLGLGAYIVASIFYVMPSGLPQLADGLILFTIGATFLVCWRTLPRDPMLYTALALFCIWTGTVNFIWFHMYHDLDLIKKPLFYVFNSLVFVFVVAAGYHDWDRLRTVVRWACIVAIGVEVAYLLFVSGSVYKETYRSLGTFNNPNQLGYWGLLMIACLAVSKERSRLTLIDLTALGGGFYILMVSLSKAASISGMLLILFVVWFCRVGQRTGLLLAVLAVCALLYQGVNGDLIDNVRNTSTVSNLEHRLSSIGTQRDDDLTQERGYLRIAQFPQYIAFGAGEGAFSRFTGKAPWDRGNEFHSTLGNLLFSYGLVGLALFVILLWKVFARAPLDSQVYLIPIMMYGVTHMGLRFSEFWIFLALVYSQSLYSVARAQHVRPSISLGRAPYGSLETRVQE